jgi:anti-anti-sigma factor
MYDNDFIYEEVGDICFETVNFSRATFKETEVFRNRIKKDIENGKKNIVVDLSLCDFCDSSFLGALVVCTKKSFSDSNQFSIIVRQGTSLSYIFYKTGLDRVFTIYKTREDALKLFTEKCLS